MTTQTKTLAEQLAELTAKREKAQAAVMKAKRQRDTWNAETQAMRAELTTRRYSYPEEHEGSARQFEPKPNTDSARLAEAVKTRLAEVNPADDTVAKATKAYLAAELAERGFRARHFEDVLAETGPNMDEINSAVAEAADALAQALGDYLTGAEANRGMIDAADGLDGRNYDYDSRALDWQRLAREIANNPLNPPAIDERARHQLRLQVANVEAENDA